MRLIDADELRAVKFHALPYTHIHPVGAEPYSYELGWNDAIDAIIDSADTVDAEPVRHGHWIGIGESDWDYERGEPVYYEWKCSKCGHIYDSTDFIYYCYHCGAKMDEEARR